MTLASDGKLRYFRVAEGNDSAMPKLPKPSGEINLMATGIDRIGIVEVSDCHCEWPSDVRLAQCFGLMAGSDKSARTYFFACIDEANCTLWKTALRKAAGLPCHSYVNDDAMAANAARPAIPTPQKGAIVYSSVEETESLRKDLPKADVNDLYSMPAKSDAAERASGRGHLLRPASVPGGSNYTGATGVVEDVEQLYVNVSLDEHEINKDVVARGPLNQAGPYASVDLKSKDRARAENGHPAAVPPLAPKISEARGANPPKKGGHGYVNVAHLNTMGALSTELSQTAVDGPERKARKNAYVNDPIVAAHFKELSDKTKQNGDERRDNYSNCTRLELIKLCRERKLKYEGLENNTKAMAAALRVADATALRSYTNQNQGPLPQSENIDDGTHL